MIGYIVLDCKCDVCTTGWIGVQPIDFGGPVPASVQMEDWLPEIACPNCNSISVEVKEAEI